MSGERRGMTFPAHHLVGADLSFTCTNCGGHTSTTPPCIPAKTYPTPEPSEVAETTAGERCLCAHVPSISGAPDVSCPRCAPAEPDAGEVVLTDAEWDDLRSENMYDTEESVRRFVDAVLAARVSAAATKARADERERIARQSERLRRENPMNGDGANYMLDRVQAAIGVPEAIADERRTVQAEREDMYARLEAENAASIARGDAR